MNIVSVIDNQFIIMQLFAEAMKIASWGFPSKALVVKMALTGHWIHPEADFFSKNLKID